MTREFMSPTDLYNRMFGHPRYTNVSAASSGVVSNGNTISFSPGPIAFTADDSPYYKYVTKAFKKETDMGITIKTVRLHAGWVAQLEYREQIVWESSRTYKTEAKAVKAAEKMRLRGIENLFA